MTSEHYHKFIEEVYIDPIRSVLIVDDDYPTLAEILASGDRVDNTEPVHGAKLWHRRPEPIARMIGAFRRKPRPLLVDVHDGHNVPMDVEAETATHLHQSDLLVLDYELDRTRPQDGSRAIAVLGGVMANEHFNLVVIHTKEDLDFVFDAVRLGLVTPASERLSDAESEDAQNWIDEGEDDFEGFENALLESIDAEQYVYSRLNESSYLETMLEGEPPYVMFAEHANRVEWSVVQRQVVCRQLLRAVEQKMEVYTGTSNRFADLTWSVSDPKWIATNASFVAFAKKTDEDDLLDQLKTALVGWNPPPSRLVLAKIRAAIDEHGVVAQGPALRDRHALAYWYHRLLSGRDEEDRHWRIAESVSRHAEQLLKETLPYVEAFVWELVTAERAVAEPTARCREHFGVNLNDDGDKLKAALEHNAFVCSMEPVGWHLTAGHVFSMADDLWLCVSPSCDMIPAQIPPWREDALGARLPFIAIMLQQVEVNKMPKHVHSNRFVFLRLDGAVRGYRFNSARGDSAPHWQLLYAENRGHLTGDNCEFTVSCIQQDESQLVARRRKANVVSQLRYEYALNLIQKLGISLTRIGLDFTDGVRS